MLPEDLDWYVNRLHEQLKAEEEARKSEAAKIKAAARQKRRR
mgnify:CR=1 FL=1